MTLNAVHLSASVSSRAGGVGAVVCALAARMRDDVVRARVLTFADGSAPLEPLPNIEALRPTFRGPLVFTPELGARLRALPSIDIIHNHGLWMPTGAYARREANRRNIPLVISPHGMLDPWALRKSRVKKAIARVAFENSNLARATCMHALCDAEAESIRAAGLDKPIRVIPNGVSLPATPPSIRPPWHGSLPANGKVLLFLGRIHAKKNLVALLEAWSEFNRRRAKHEWHLVIAGWGRASYLRRLERLAHEISIRVHWVGPLYGVAKDAALYYARGFILPSLSEGLPMSILEAWSYRLPVIMTPECNYREAFSRSAAIHTTSKRTDICDAIEQLSELTPEQAAQIGESGYRLVLEKYTWDKVADQFRSLYLALA